jgi:hypothetical protein
LEKQIFLLSYWLGVVCVVLCVILRLLAEVGVSIHTGIAGGVSFSYLTFFRGAMMLLLLTIATATLSWAKRQP